MTSLYAQALEDGIADEDTLHLMRSAIRKVSDSSEPIFEWDYVNYLAWAFDEGDSAAVDFWLEAGADINAKIDGESLLKSAVRANDLGTVKLLVDKGIDVSTLEWLPLEYSYRLTEIKDCVIYIIDHGGAQAVDEEGISLLDRINDANYATAPILQHLHHNGVDITQKFSPFTLKIEGIEL